METVYSVTLALCLLSHCKSGKLEVLPTKDIDGACSASCDVCTDLVSDLLKNPKTCSHHCKCLGDLHRMMNQETSLGCRPIKHDVFCRLGRKVDSNGCVLGSCNTWLPCAHENPLANCTKLCPHGYKMDIFGCPLCECLCSVDQVGESIFVHECAMKCNNRYSMVEQPTGGCPHCHCMGPRRISNKKSCKEAPVCPKNCGTWGYWFHCDEKESSCRCDCPMNKIECSRVQCSWGHASMVRDEFGCVAGCKCSEGTKEDTEDLVKCPSGVKCPLECGPYKLKRMYDARGCLKECKCECLPSLCERPCLKRVPLNDMYGCPTCSCTPNWAQCPHRCSTSCGFHKRLLPDDERGCPSTCECKCSRATEANKETSVSHLLRPPLLCPIDCDEFVVKRDRFGCDRCECRTVQCPKRTCLRTCGPHGFKTDANDCETCECNCPLTDLCAPCTNGHYARDGYGCETCNCECPLLLDCRIRCIYGREVDELGCEKCRCVTTPYAVHKARQPEDHHCEEEDCELDCEFYHRSTSGCKKCRCCEKLHCPDVKCDDGQQQVDENQCPTCKCSVAKRPQIAVVEPKERYHCPPLKDCKVQCPKTSLKVDDHLCPICECLDREEKDSLKRVEHRCKAVTDCVNACSSGFYRTKEDCSTCECCEDRLALCPDLKCSVFKTDTERCPVCECASFHSIKSSSEHSQINSQCPPFYCHRDCSNVSGLLKLDEKNCPRCECCDPHLQSCPHLRCSIFKRHPSNGCPICECL